jgi:hypothetical protein
MVSIENAVIPTDMIPTIATNLIKAFNILKSDSFPEHQLARDYIAAVQRSIMRHQLPFEILLTRMHCGRKTLKLHFERANFPIKTKSGPLCRSNREEIERRLEFLRNGLGLDVGYKRAAESIVHPGQDPPYGPVYSLMCHPEPKPEKLTNLHTHRFHAKYVDYLWHTDLHQLSSTVDKQGNTHILYMIAFMDDASRFITGYSLLRGKTAQTTAEALREVLRIGMVPAVLGSDNGGEFRGRMFTDLLIEYQIKPWYGQPYTPQQNGKIERFWGTLESSIDGSRDPMIIANFISMYNNHWIHRSLGFRAIEARFSIPHYLEQIIEISENIEENLVWEK